MTCITAAHAADSMMTTTRRQYCRLRLFHVLKTPSLLFLGLKENGSDGNESLRRMDVPRVTHHILDAIRKVAVTFVRRLSTIQASPNCVIVFEKMD